MKDVIPKLSELSISVDSDTLLVLENNVLLCLMSCLNSPNGVSIQDLSNMLRPVLIDINVPNDKLYVVGHLLIAHAVTCSSLFVLKAYRENSKNSTVIVPTYNANLLGSRRMGLVRARFPRLVPYYAGDKSLIRQSFQNAGETTNVTSTAQAAKRLSKVPYIINKPVLKWLHDN